MKVTIEFDSIEDAQELMNAADTARAAKLALQNLWDTLGGDPKLTEAQRGSLKLLFVAAVEKAGYNFEFKFTPF